MATKKTEEQALETKAETPEEFVARMKAKKQPEGAKIEPCKDCPKHGGFGTD